MCLCWHWLENVIFSLSQCSLYKGLALIFERLQNIYLWKSIYSAICNRYQSININILYEIHLLYPSFKFLRPHEQIFMCHIQRDSKLLWEAVNNSRLQRWPVMFSDSTCVTWGAHTVHVMRIPCLYKTICFPSKGGLQMMFSTSAHHQCMLTAIFIRRDVWTPSQRLEFLQRVSEIVHVPAGSFRETVPVMQSDRLVGISVLSVWLLLLLAFNF